MEARNFAFVLDNAAYQWLKGENISVFNISKLPISLQMFGQWFQKNVINKDRKIWPLMEMVKSTIFNLAAAALKTKSPDKIGQEYNPTLDRDTVPVINGLPDTSGMSGVSSLKKSKDVSAAYSTGRNLWEYYVIYDKKYYEERVNQYLADGTDDTNIYEKNVNVLRPHFYIGADRGLLKSFNFQKVALGEQIAIARNLKGGNEFQKIWSIFNVNLTLLGTDLLRVGKIFYLDPTGAGMGSPFTKGSISNIMGLGGYYFVEKVHHTYYPTWETTVEARSIVPAFMKSSYDGTPEFVYY